MRIQTFLFHKLPYPLDQVEIGRIRWQERQFYIQTSGFIHDQSTSLTASIIQNDGDGYAYVTHRNLFQEHAYALSRNVGVISDCDHFMRNSIQCAQNIEPLTTGWRWYKNTRY